LLGHGKGPLASQKYFLDVGLSQQPTRMMNGNPQVAISSGHEVQYMLI
jgi:hypothetical protein